MNTDSGMPEKTGLGSGVATACVGVADKDAASFSERERK
jgi:hypothetical protein